MNIKSERSVKYLIYSDLKRAGGGNLIVRLFSNASFSILFWYRIGNYLKKKRNILCKMFYPIIFIIHKHNKVWYTISFIFRDWGRHVVRSFFGNCFRNSQYREKLYFLSMHYSWGNTWKRNSNNW